MVLLLSGQSQQGNPVQPTLYVTLVLYTPKASTPSRPRRLHGDLHGGPFRPSRPRAGRAAVGLRYLMLKILPRSPSEQTTSVQTQARKRARPTSSGRMMVDHSGTLRLVLGRPDGATDGSGLATLCHGNSKRVTSPQPSVVPSGRPSAKRRSPLASTTKTS